MKKVILWVAVLLVAFVPTYILVFQGIKTAVPEAYLGDIKLSASDMIWTTDDGNGNVKPIKPMDAVMEFVFNFKDIGEISREITSLEDLNKLKFEQKPDKIFIDIFNESADKPYYTLADIQSGDYPNLTERTQVMVEVRWVISSRVGVRAFYSFEYVPGGAE